MYRSQFHNFLQFSQFFHKIISTRLLTVLTRSVIVHIEQREGKSMRHLRRTRGSPFLMFFETAMRVVERRYDLC